jgi:hypothetical protein
VKKPKTKQNDALLGSKAVTIIWTCRCWDGNQIWTVPLNTIIWRDQVYDGAFLPVQVPCPMCCLRNIFGKIATPVLNSDVTDLENLRNDQIELEDQEGEEVAAAKGIGGTHE